MSVSVRHIGGHSRSRLQALPANFNGSTRLSVLAMSLASALASPQVWADDTPASGSTTYTWDSTSTATDVTILNGVSINVPSAPAIAVVSGTTHGILTVAGNLTGSASAIAISSGASIAQLSVDTSGSISGAVTGIANAGGIGTLSNAGQILGSSNGIHNTGSIGRLTNTGAVYSDTAAIQNDGGSIGTLFNSSLLHGGFYAVSNTGHIDTLTNAFGGTIYAVVGIGVDNLVGGTIDSLLNSGLIISRGTVGFGVNGYGVSNAGAIGLLNNAGVISGATVGSVDGAGIYNTGTIGTVSNAGTINADAPSSYLRRGLDNEASGAIGLLDNTSTGRIVGIDAGIYNAGSITRLMNEGTISGATIGLNNLGTITSLVNSGLIVGQTALSNSLSIGTFTNTGTIAGAIANTSASDLTVNGGTGSSFGTLTGASGSITAADIGTIASNTGVVFASGNQLLNDNITATGVSLAGGTVRVNNTITINGNYTQSAAATLLIGVSSSAVTNGLSSDSGYGSVIVNGNAVVASGASIQLTSTGGSYGFAAGQRYVVIQATGTGTSYNEGSLNYSIAGYTSSITGLSTLLGGYSALVLTINSATLATSGSGSTAIGPTTANAIGALGALQRYAGVSDAALLNLYNASLAIGSTAEANHAGSQLTPAGQLAASRAAVAPTFDTLNIVGAHADGLRLAQTGVATGDEIPKYGVWGQAFGGHASLGMSNSVSGYSANYGGLMVGIDRAISDGWTAGGVFTYSNTRVNGSDDNTGSHTTVNAYGLLGYASYTGEPWYANLSGGVVQQRYNTTRVVNFSGFSGTADGAFSGQQYVARAELGYPLTLASMTLTPLASLTYSYLHQQSYTESGGNGAALAVDSSHASSVRSTLGAKLERSFSIKYGVIVPFVQLQWIHEFVGARQVTAASFAADTSSGTAFTTVGASPVQNYADLSLGATLLRSNNLTLTARYDVQAAAHFVSQTGSIRLLERF